jgi:hypothetical protein
MCFMAVYRSKTTLEAKVPAATRAAFHKLTMDQINLQLPGRLIFGLTQRRLSTRTLQLKTVQKTDCSRCWGRKVTMGVILSLLLDRDGSAEEKQLP